MLEQLMFFRAIELIYTNKTSMSHKIDIYDYLAKLYSSAEFNMFPTIRMC